MQQLAVKVQKFEVCIIWHNIMLKTIKRGWSLLQSATRDLHAKKKRSPHWRTVQKEFLSKHNECAACGSKTQLQVHHKFPFDDYPELELDPNNLIVLCMSEKDCHLRIAHGGSFRRWCPKLDQYIYQIKIREKTFEEIWKLAKEERLDKRIGFSKSSGA
jgi:hypothetical protein